MTNKTLVGKVYSQPERTNGDWQFKVWRNDDGKGITCISMGIKTQPNVRVGDRVTLEGDYINPEQFHFHAITPVGE